MEERTIIGASSGAPRYFIEISMFKGLLPNVILDSNAREEPCMTAVYIFEVLWLNVHAPNIISVGHSQTSDPPFEK